MEKIYFTFNGHQAEAEYQGQRRFYRFVDLTPAGERLEVEITKVEDSDTSYSLPRLWYKHGYTDKILTNYWSAEVFATDEKRHCWNRCNPQIIAGTNKINFDWIEEATTANLIALINEIVARAYAK